jgi:ATP adenylyltransferase
MQSLWAPWRMDYILSDRKGKNCIFCRLRKPSDEKRLILHRTAFSLVMLNRYPYAYAHLMVAPLRHVHEVSKLKPAEMQDIFCNVGKSIDILKKAFHPSGFNVGMNLGQVGGAGILHHLHFHIIPRWKGDMNFMPTLAACRIIPEHLQKTYERLRPFYQKGEG